MTENASSNERKILQAAMSLAGQATCPVPAVFPGPAGIQGGAGTAALPPAALTQLVITREAEGRYGSNDTEALWGRRGALPEGGPLHPDPPGLLDLAARWHTCTQAEGAGRKSSYRSKSSWKQRWDGHPVCPFRRPLFQLLPLPPGLGSRTCRVRGAGVKGRAGGLPRTSYTTWSDHIPSDGC